MLDISVGACLLERLKPLRSFRPSFLSIASLLAQVSAFSSLLARFLRLGLLRVASAFARAPKEIEAASSGSGSDEEDDF